MHVLAVQRLESLVSEFIDGFVNGSTRIVKYLFHYFETI